MNSIATIMDQYRTRRHVHRWLIMPALGLLLTLGLFGMDRAFSTQANLNASAMGSTAVPAKTPALTPDVQVLAYTGGKEVWELKTLKDLSQGQEFQFDQHLCYVDPNGLVRLNPDVAVAKLNDADRTYVKDHWRFPENEDVVRFIDQDNKHVRHDRMGTLTLGDRFWFQGRLYEVRSDPQRSTGLSICNTGIVLSRVTNTYIRKTDTLIDLTVTDVQGKESVITGTPEHPFFVQAVNGYVPLGRLMTGTVLKTDNGFPATVKDSKARHGEFDVYNFEVEDQHNYYVAAPNGGPAVLVHNTCNLPGEYLSGKAPHQVTPGTTRLTGQYINDLGRVEPWEAYYDEFGRQIGRTDFNAGDAAQGIDDIHHHIYEFGPGYGPKGLDIPHRPGPNIQ